MVVLLALLSSLTVPRIFGTQKRVFQQTANQVADLMLMYAQRDRLGQKPVGLLYSETDNWLMLVVLSEDDAIQGIDPSWELDATVAPVKLPSFIEAGDLVVYTDGISVDIRDWPLANSPGRDLPTIEIELYGPDGQLATVVLPSGAIAPDVYGFDQYPIPRAQAIDLDAIGRSREDW